jgi:hypothetical protein
MTTLVVTPVSHVVENDPGTIGAACTIDGAKPVTNSATKKKMPERYRIMSVYHYRN